jgi:hypothetical protein
MVQNAEMNRLLRAFVLAAVLLPSTSLAETETHHLVGEVLDAVPALSPYGVVPGAAVDVSWTVDLATPASNVSGPPDDKSDYPGALDFLVMGQIDQGIVSVANDSGGSLDLLHVSTPGADNDLVLHGPAMGGVAALPRLYAPNGGASSDRNGGESRRTR